MSAGCFEVKETDTKKNVWQGKYMFKTEMHECIQMC